MSIFHADGEVGEWFMAARQPLAAGRRLRVYLATGTYKHELADARWVT